MREDYSLSHELIDREFSDEVASLEEQVREHPARLSELIEQQLGSLERLASELPTSALSVVQRECTEACRSLERALERMEVRMPKPKGVFVSAEERRAACTVMCTCLREVNAVLWGLRQTALALAPALRCLTAMMGCLLKTEKTVVCMIEVEKRVSAPPIRGRLLDLREQLTALERRRLSLAEELTEGRRRICSFCDTVLAPFCLRASKLSDAERGGEQSDRLAFLNLCGELRTAYTEFERKVTK